MKKTMVMLASTFLLLVSFGPVNPPLTENIAFGPVNPPLTEMLARGPVNPPLTELIAKTKGPINPRGPINPKVVNC